MIFQEIPDNKGCYTSTGHKCQKCMDYLRWDFFWGCWYCWNGCDTKTTLTDGTTFNSLDKPSEV